MSFLAPKRDPKEVQLQLLRNAEERKRKIKRDEFGAQVIECVLYILILALFFVLLKYFMKK